MAKSPGTAIAPIAPPAEKLPDPQHLDIAAALLLAAESISTKDSSQASYLRGVFLHSRDGKGRVVGTDGARMFLASFALPAKEQGGVPAWLKDGIILSNDQLKSRLSLLLKLSDDPQVRVTFAKGKPAIELSDLRSQTVFKVDVLDATYPDYEKVLGAQSFSDPDAEGNIRGREWAPIGINSAYLKQCGELARVLENGLEKSARSKLGMVIRAFTGGDLTAPMVFDFSTWPGAILVVAPTKMPTDATSKETAALLAPAVKATVAALRAHATRWKQKADASEHEWEKAEALRKSAEFNARVAAVMRTVATGLRVTADTPAPAPQPEVKAVPEPQPEPEPTPEDQPAPEDESTASGGGEQPAVKRTRIHVKQAA